MINDFSGDYLNFDSTRDREIIEIIEEGKREFNETLKKEIYNIKVKKGNKTMTYSPNNSAGKVLQQAFGMDDKNWIGKKFEIIHSDKKMLIRPIMEEMAI